MKKILLKLSMLMILPIALIGCGNTKNEDTTSDKLKVTVSISPLKEFTEAIGGDKVEVTTLVPENTEPHDFDFKPRDLEKVMNEKLFIYNGLGMEDWLSQLEGKDINLIDSSKDADIIRNGNKTDPHLWLSLKGATSQSYNIKNALVEVDPDNEDYYEENYNKFKAELDGLYDEYKTKFSDIKTKDFVTSHAAFAYLCRDFGLQQKSINDIFGEEGEERPQDKVNLIKYCIDNNITTIFSEGTDSNKKAESYATDIGGKVESIYTLETKVEGKSYIEAMRYNLDVIYNSMK
ncbi:metal ABC transporter solute-binding protein, Zn/Mn family [Clostridium paraputrificum]|uniref:metal ABC transporter solute-binding protein, Zn/Mn family n=1 Tax=Clostridium TaxID=1485 RepID=UPI003D32931E